VAAVNPYREHSKEMIKKLESAGLGYHIQADKTLDKLGKIPMRRLVYRCQFFLLLALRPSSFRTDFIWATLIQQ
jgi:hypothetical protein